jgi:WD40 repeat protein
MCGSHDACYYALQTVLRVQGHDDDVNAVVFMEPSSNIVATGSDDALIKVMLSYSRDPSQNCRCKVESRRQSKVVVIC